MAQLDLETLRWDELAVANSEYILESVDLEDGKLARSAPTDATGKRDAPERVPGPTKKPRERHA